MTVDQRTLDVVGGKGGWVLRYLKGASAPPTRVGELRFERVDSDNALYFRLSLPSDSFEIIVPPEVFEQHIHPILMAHVALGNY